MPATTPSEFRRTGFRNPRGSFGSNRLAPGGRCAVVIPNHYLDGSSTALGRLRRTLAHHYNLLLVVSLEGYGKNSLIVFSRPAEGEVLDQGPVLQAAVMPCCLKGDARQVKERGVRALIPYPARPRNPGLAVIDIHSPNRPRAHRLAKRASSVGKG